jgi:Ca2+:H+ antiporter
MLRFSTLRSVKMPVTAWLWPLLALGFFAWTGGYFPADAVVHTGPGAVMALTLVVILLGAVFSSVYHAEVIAKRTGEPYGTIILSVAVTVIEVALIVSILVSGEGKNATIARDTVYAVVMIVCAGLVGLCIFVGGIRHHEQNFRVTGASAYLAVLLSMSTLVLILPNYTQSVPGPVYSTSQLIFISAITLALYGVFLYIQTVRHRDYFIMSGPWGDDALSRLASAAGTATASGAPSPEPLTKTPQWADVAVSSVLLIVALSGVVLLAKMFSTLIQVGVTSVGAPDAVVGVAVALLILLPEGVAAVKAARNDELQKSINLALGSSLATIGLTIPAIAILSVALNQDLVLGLAPRDALLLILVLAVSIMTFATGRTNVLFGFVHLVIFATFGFLSFVP